MGLFDLGVGGLYRGAKSFMNPGKGYEKAQDQYDNYYNQSQDYLQPYNQNGQDIYPELRDATSNLLNPMSLMDKFLQDYEMSDAAKFSQNRAHESGLNALSATGMMGSTPGLQALQYGQSEIGAQDQERFIERMINQYLQGASLAQGIYGQGANTAGQQSNNAMTAGNNAASMAYGKQNAPGEMFGNLLGTGAGLYAGSKGWTTTGGGK